MKQYDLVMICMSTLNEWENGYENRNRHVLASLAKDQRIRKILIIDYPPYNARRVVRSFIDRALAKPAGTIISRDATSRLVHVTSARTIHHPELYELSTIDSAFSDKLLTRRIRQAVMQLQFRDVLLWSYVPFFQTTANHIGEEMFVFDAVDNWMEHPSYVGLRSRLKADYESIRRTAGVVFTVSPALARLFPGRSNVYTVANGVEWEHFTSVAGNVPADIAPIPDPIVLYSGIIEHRFDHDVVRALARKDRRRSIVLIGPVWETASVAQLQTEENVHFLGRKTYDELPLYFREASCGIIPHIQNALTASMNPLKLYQYLAAGLPVVTTPIEGSESFPDVVHAAASDTDFDRYIREAISSDTPQKQNARKELMKAYDWSKKTETMMDIVDRTVRPSSSVE